MRKKGIERKRVKNNSLMKNFIWLPKNETNKLDSW